MSKKNTPTLNIDGASISKSPMYWISIQRLLFTGIFLENISTKVFYPESFAILPV